MFRAPFSRRRALPFAAAMALAIVPTLLPAPALAAPVTDYEMPFPCAQEWTGTTRSSHSPSPLSIDFNRPDDIGDPVVAPAVGVVRTADSVDNGGYGKYIVLDHGNGESSVYAHLSTVQVAVGQRVEPGVQIGQVGGSGNVTGPHLHFEERINGTDTAPYFSGNRFVFGSTLASRNCVDVPLAADWNGDGVGQVGVFRRASTARFMFLKPDGGTTTRWFGANTDEPIVGDWDGNRTATVGVRRTNTSTFVLRTETGQVTIRLGAPADKPIAGDWNGDGRDEVGVRRAGAPVFVMRAANGTTSQVTLGAVDDVPVTGDWDGNGRTDLAAFDVATATWRLRYVADGTVRTASVRFGAAGDIPVAADWDGNGTTDLGVWRPATATFRMRQAPTPMATSTSVTTRTYGNAR